MSEREIIQLENNKDYVIIKEIENYLYLVNKNDYNDICFRKKVKEDDKEYIIGLKDEKEFDYVLKLFNK